MVYLYNEYVRSRSRRFRKYFHPMEWGHRWGWEWERLVSASNLLRYINHRCRDEEEIYRTITRERIAQLPDEINDGTRTNRKMLEESGFMEAIDAYYDEIVGGMKLEHMPPQEIEVMRELGSSDPEAELSALIYIVKSRCKSKHSYNQEVRISNQLKNLEQKLEQQEQQLKELKEEELKEEPEKQPKKSKRWFKGLGQIAQGSALSIANIGLAMGAITVPVAAETAGWGAIVSSITGVGMVLNGVGEFRGE
ncbi:MAG: hypothetical protein NUV74_08005 [Candidatus Brocadiaceae bacterium]|nr:hypothetical protein [Candidatus Brocadiaceae bacterium]